MSDRRARILESAVGVFGRYGFKRCSMEDIAEAAGMSRPALYQHFKNKTEIFRAGSEWAQNSAVDAAAVIAAAPAMTLAERLGAMLMAYKGPAWRVIATTPHGEEMLGLNATLAEDVTELAIARAVEVFAEAIDREQAGGWDAAETASLLTASAWAASMRAKDEAAFEATMRGLAVIWAAAVTRPKA
ncbi:MAG: helix-turn-helix domain-containing protein [Pseudomonadota bacterium]